MQPFRYIYKAAPLVAVSCIFLMLNQNKMENQFSEYKLVMGAEGGIKFTAEVNQLISDGWQPIGGVSVVITHGQKTDNQEMLARGLDLESKILTFQAMVK